MKDLQKWRVDALHRRWLVLASLVAAVNCYANDDSPVRSINVNYDGETYVCDAVMLHRCSNCWRGKFLPTSSTWRNGSPMSAKPLS